MFLESSRYFKVATTQAKTADGREVTAVKLRRLPVIDSEPTVVQGNDQLDVIAHRLYGEGDRFWRIADANSELQANDLVKEAGRVIEVEQR